MGLAGEDRYPMGARVTYADAQATVSDGVAGLVTGTVNGPAFDLDPERPGEITHVSVWTERDNGREPTSIMVAVANIVDVDARA
jgi:hypothetical protein